MISLILLWMVLSIWNRGRKARSNDTRADKYQPATAGGRKTLSVWLYNSVQNILKPAFDFLIYEEHILTRCLVMGFHKSLEECSIFDKSLFACKFSWKSVWTLIILHTDYPVMTWIPGLAITMSVVFLLQRRYGLKPLHYFQQQPISTRHRVRFKCNPLRSPSAGLENKSKYVQPKDYFLSWSNHVVQ